MFKINCIEFRETNHSLNGGDTMSLEEKFNQAKGSVKEGVGKLTGDTKTQAEGVAEKVASKAKEVAEDAKGAVEGAIEGVKNIIKKDDK